MTPHHPLVHRVPPPDDLPKDHHGPPPSTSASSGYIASPNGSSGLFKPRYFQNPWKSWRNPSLTDAWIAYQKGAAIALPLHKTARTAKRSFGTEQNGTIPGNEPSYDHEEGPGGRLEEDEVEYDPRDPDGAIRETRLYPIPSRTYVRPELSLVHEDDEESDWADPPLQVVTPQWERQSNVDVTWSGHASVSVRVPWKEKGAQRKEEACGILFDPIFSYRCSPSQWVGPARYLEPPCSIADLPPIHVVCISHDHYDHLDYYSIIDSWKYHSATVHFFVPFGLAQWFVSSGIPEDRVTELDWWHETILSFPSPASAPSTSQSRPPTPGADKSAALNLKVVFTPGQHRTGRGSRDHMTTLWGSWCVGVVDDKDAERAAERGMRDWSGSKLFFGGDTGYRYATAPEDDPDAVCPAFQQISDLYGPVSFALLPLSTGSSLPFLRNILSLSSDQYTLTSSQHCSPGDASEIHRIMQSERTSGIHWGTFCDSDEARGTRVTFGRERRARGVSGSWTGDEDGARGKGRFVTANIGETSISP